MAVTPRNTSEKTFAAAHFGSSLNVPMADFLSELRKRKAQHCTQTQAREEILSKNISTSSKHPTSATANIQGAQELKPEAPAAMPSNASDLIKHYDNFSEHHFASSDINWEKQEADLLVQCSMRWAVHLKRRRIAESTKQSDEEKSKDNSVQHKLSN